VTVATDAEPDDARHRQPPMKHLVRPAVMIIALAVLTSACASAGSSPAPSDEAPPSQAPTASESPGIGEPEPGGVELVEPQAGQQNVHPVAIERMDATASGTVVSVDAYWTSGVDPCYVLDRIEVRSDKEDKTVDVTIFEGTSDPDAICVMMAVSKHTIFSFEVQSTGTWTIRDSQGGTQPVEVVVS
jgi:hypothetical protein